MEKNRYLTGKNRCRKRLGEFFGSERRFILEEGNVRMSMLAENLHRIREYAVLPLLRKVLRAFRSLKKKTNGRSIAAESVLVGEKSNGE